MATEGQVIARLSELHNDITCQMDLNPPADIVSPYQLKVHNQQLQETTVMYRSFILQWNTLINNHAESIGPDGVQGWRQWKSTLDTKFKAYKLQSINKAEEIDVTPDPGPPLPRQSTHIPGQPGDLLSATMDLTAIATLQQSLSASQAAERKADARADIQASIKQSMLELRDLTAQYSAAPDWEMADDHEVETAMTDIKTWESKLKEIKKEQIKIESSTARHDIHDLDDEIDTLNTRIKLTKTELEEATQAIKDADISKGLCTNRKTRSTPLKLPTFSGRPGEDYLDFQEKFEKAAVSN